MPRDGLYRPFWVAEERALHTAHSIGRWTPGRAIQSPDDRYYSVICMVLLNARSRPRLRFISPSLHSLIDKQLNSNDADFCRVPIFTKAIGHEEKYKLHNPCLLFFTFV